MSNTIKTYNHLLEERSRLQQNLAMQKQAMHANIASIKQSLKPATVAYSFVSKFFTKGANNPVLNVATQVATAAVLKKLVRKKIGWYRRRFLEILISNFFANTLRPVINFIGQKVLYKLRPTRTTNVEPQQY